MSETTQQHSQESVQTSRTLPDNTTVHLHQLISDPVSAGANFVITGFDDPEKIRITRIWAPNDGDRDEMEWGDSYLVDEDYFAENADPQFETVVDFRWDNVRRVPVWAY